MMLHIQLEEKQEALLRRFASDKNLSLSDFVHRAVLEYLEDEADRRAFEAAKREFAADPVTYSHEEVLRLLDEE